MRNYVQPGNSLAIAVPYAGGILSGQGVLVGALFGVAAVDGAQNAIIEAATQGVFDITKEPALAITAGARVFWDNTNRRLTTTATGNFQVGIASLAALAADTTVRVVAQPRAGARHVSIDPKATRGYRNRNPGNIEHVPANKWQGLAEPPSDGRFCRFTSHEFGIRALAALLVTYQDRHKLRTPRAIIERWAPQGGERHRGLYRGGGAADRRRAGRCDRPASARSPPPAGRGDHPP